MIFFCCTILFHEQAPSCVLKFALRSVFQEQAPSCVLKFALWERVSGASSLVCTEICFAGACFRSKLPRVYWLGYLPGSVFQEQAPSCVLVGVLTRKRVSGASSLVCSGLNRGAKKIHRAECYCLSRHVLAVSRFQCTA